jgi:Domain of unknown function (DUF4129)
MADEHEKYRKPDDPHRLQSLALGAAEPVVDSVALEHMLDGDGLAEADKKEEERKPRQLLQPALRVLAEAGWITVVYAAAAVMVSHIEPILGPIEFSIFVLFGALVAWIGRRSEGFGPFLLIIAVIAGGALGWLMSSEARDLLPNLPAAFDVNLAGWLAGVAVLRGAIINIGEKAAEEIERLLRTVPVALAVIWAYVTIAAQRDLLLPFAVTAMWGTVTFLSASVISVGLARLNVLHAGVVDDNQRRGWRWIVAGVGLAIVPIAIPIGLLSGIPLAALVTPIGGPLQLLGSILVIPLQIIVFILSEIFRPIAGPLGQFLDELNARMNGRIPPKAEETNNLGVLLGLALWVFTIFVVLLAIYMIAKWLLRRKDGLSDELDAEDADTERVIVMPTYEPKHDVARSRRRRGAPHDAVQAYMSALHELDSNPDYARQTSETPAGHAQRLRRMGAPGNADLARLAVDYQLARYGERRITSLENVRAVSRFQRFRRLLRTSSA